MVVHTQVCRAGMDGRITGLDYGRVEAGLRMAGIDVTPELFEGLRIIETAYVNELNNNRRG